MLVEFSVDVFEENVMTGTTIIDSQVNVASLVSIRIHCYNNRATAHIAKKYCQPLIKFFTRLPVTAS